MFVIHTERFLFHFFKLYLSKRPKYLQSNDLFYLSVIVNPKSGVCYNVTEENIGKNAETYSQVAKYNNNNYWSQQWRVD